MPYIFPDHKAGDVIHIAGVGKVTIQAPMGSPDPVQSGPEPKLSDYTPTYQSALHGHKHGDAFEQSNYTSPIQGGVVYVNDSGISGLELRFFGREVITTGKAKGDQHEFNLKDEDISGIQGTYNENHLTSLTLLTTKDRRLKFGTIRSSHIGFSWNASAAQVVVGMSGFAGDMIHGLSMIYTDSKDDPVYNPAEDASIGSLSSRDIVGPRMQELFRNGNYAELATQTATQTENIANLYGNIAAIVNDGLNPWAIVVDELGMELYTHYDIPTETAVYVQAAAGETPNPSPGSETMNVSIGTASGPEGFTVISSMNMFLGGVAGYAATSRILSSFSKFFCDWVIKKSTQFIGNALEVLASKFAAAGVLKASARVWAAQAGRIIGITARVGFTIFSAVIGGLFGWGIQIILDWAFKTYYLSIRVYNHDSAKVEWTPTSYYGQNEVIPKGDWQAASIPVILDAGTTQWIPGIGKVTTQDWVGAYNSYVFENDYAGAGLAVAMAVQKGSGPDGFMFEYEISKVLDNSMALTWGLMDVETYLHYNYGIAIKTLIIQQGLSPILMTSPALSGDSQGFYSCSIVIGTFPPTPK